MRRVRLETPEPSGGPRVLCVVAHPDDELAFGGLLYRTAKHLGGRCDVAVVTNGEGGYKYATLAEGIYGLRLTEEAVGREHLPRLRAAELAAGCTLLGVHTIHHLDQRDHRYTTDPMEVLSPTAGIWDLGGVRDRLEATLRGGRYDFLLMLAPTATTHGHHQAAGLLALEARERLPLAERPVALCVLSGHAEQPDPRFQPRPEFPRTELARDEAFIFDRTQGFGHGGRLDYRIVVNWAIAEHKSQGTMQLLVNRGESEHYFLLAGGPADAGARCEAWFDALAGPWPGTDR